MLRIGMGDPFVSMRRGKAMAKDYTATRGMVVSAAAAVLFLSSCQTAYYSTMEKFGYHKRDLLASRVEDVRDAQTEAKEQFQSALERFSTVLNFQGGELEEEYRGLKSEFDRSEAKAEEVRQRIASVESVSEALFDEWEDELAQYSNDAMRRTSEQRLVETRARYHRLVGAMKKAEKKMDPVLAVFRDHVLFLKHNLNARAVASLQQELASVEMDVAALIRDMETSIEQADAFIEAMARE